MKIVLIGGGSYVFAPAVLEDVIIKHGLSGCEMVLVDTNQSVVQAMAAAGRRIAQDAKVPMHIWATVDRTMALGDADYVITSVAVQGAKRWRMDYEICREHGIPTQAKENGGLGGLLYSFRSITLLLSICRDMERLCPQAILLNVSNPLPKVLTAIQRFTSIPAFGFCNGAWGGPTGYLWLAQLTARRVEDIDVVTGGLNHFAWLLRINDKITGEDLMPLVMDKVQKGDTRTFRVLRRWFERYGGIAAVHVDHMGEYLPNDPEVYYTTTPPFHGNEEERRERMLGLAGIASGEVHYSKVPKFSGSSWEHPVDVAAALSQTKDQYFEILNLPNEGCLPQLPDGRIVEVPINITNGRIIGVKNLILPGDVSSLCRNQSDVNELAAEAAARGSLMLAREAVTIDEAIVDKKAALLALDRMLAIHADILPQFQ